MVGRVGQRFGDFRLLRFLGEGTFGDVYLGEQVYDHTPAAVKVFKAKLTPDKFKDFLNEVRTVLLRHPNIVQVLDFGMGEDDVPFLVMGYAPNGTILQHHPRGTQLPLPAVVSYVKQIAAALQYAHDQRRIHRDVKPENILFGANNELLLSDFGIAAVAHGSHSQRTEEAIGTALYMAPEQWQGKPLPATDQYALGIIVYEWLSGACPFEGGTLQLMYQHLHVPPSPLCGKVPALSPDVEQVIMRALAKQPQERFSRVADFAAALQGVSGVLAPTQPKIYPYASLTGTPIPPTTPAWPLRRDADVVASEIPFTTPLVTQPGQTYLPPFPPPSTEVAPLASLNPQTLAPDTSYTKRKPEKRHVSRRAVITTGLALVGVIAVGGVFVLNPSQHQSSSSPIGTLLYTYRGHSRWLNAVSWSPDGKRIASGGGDCTVQVWDATTGTHIYTYRGPASVEGWSNGSQSIVWSPDNKRIAFVGDGGMVQVWDVTTGGHVYTYRDNSGIVPAVAWSPDGKYIASTGSGKTVQVWDATTGTPIYIYRGHSNDVRTVAWSPDSKSIASGGVDSTVQVWNATTGAPIYTYRGHSDVVLVVAWSNDGKHIASGSGDTANFGGTVQVWDATTGTRVFRDNSGYVYSLAWSPYGKYIAWASGDKTVQVRDTSTDAHFYTYRGHSDVVLAVAWSPDGKRIASGSNDNTVQVWSAGS